MNENIDLTKILKDCPEGTKFYSYIFGEETYFQGVSLRKGEPRPIFIYGKYGKGQSFCLSRKGHPYADNYGECCIFPSKEMRDWSKFTAPWLKKEKDTIARLEEQGEQEEPQVYETEDGEIITYSETDEYKFVEPNFHEGDWVVRGDTIAQIVDIQEQYYVGLDINGKDFVSSRFLNCDKIHLWTIQDAKDGDVLVNGSNIFIFHFINNRRLMGYCHVNMDDGHFYNDIGRNECFCTIDAPVTPSTKEQRDLLFQKIKETGYKWNTKTNTFEKLIEPKFKVGDRVRHKETNKDDVYEISKVYDDSYGIAGFTWMIYMKYQDQYELIPNKFDPKTLKPFDKVLVKDFDETSYWTCNLFSHYNKNKGFYYCSSVPFDVCIPYNDETKHLVGTTDEAPDFYKYWEE